MEKKIAIASDHAGYFMKQRIIEYLKNMGYTVKDFGAYNSDSSDYPDFGHLIAEAIERGQYPLGITLCGTGNGINMTANKHQGIRSAVCWNEQIASLARQHNNANICALPARFISEMEAFKIVKAFLEASFEGGRHERRIQKIPVKS
ncbi:MAG: ribose 5-phosphate isomerase B [Bacteroidales bacterium]|jgi:ribose 5-phosphate isomerase B|nr:ribose 5-phosphate isomerase B [Bacteroidales bacterium]